MPPTTAIAARFQIHERLEIFKCSFNRATVGLLEFVTGDVGALCKEETSSKLYTNQ